MKLRRLLLIAVSLSSMLVNGEEIVTTLSEDDLHSPIKQKTQQRGRNGYISRLANQPQQTSQGLQALHTALQETKKTLTKKNKHHTISGIFSRLIGSCLSGRAKQQKHITENTPTCEQVKARDLQSSASIVPELSQIQQNRPFYNLDFSKPFALRFFVRDPVCKGTLSTVYDMLIHDINDGMKDVVGKKLPHKTTDVELEYKAFENEYRIQHYLTLYSHPNIVQCLGSVYDRKGLYLVFEKGGINLKTVISKRTESIPFEWVVHITKQLLEGLEFLARHQIIHRDIRSANILMSEEGRVQICDFGIACQPDIATVITWAPLPATAPEAATSEPDLNSGIDMWSLGCVLYEMASGRPLFTLTSYKAMLEADDSDGIQDVINRGADLIMNKYGYQVADLFWSLMSMDPKARITAAQALANPLFIDSEWDLAAVPSIPLLGSDTRSLSLTTEKITEENDGYMVPIMIKKENHNVRDSGFSERPSVFEGD